MTTDDPISVIHSIDAKWNAHDEEAVLQHLSDDVVIRLPPPPPPLRAVSAGSQQAREFVRTLLPGFHVESRNHRASGDVVTWNFTVSSDAFRVMGRVR